MTGHRAKNLDAMAGHRVKMFDAVRIYYSSAFSHYCSLLFGHVNCVPASLRYDKRWCSPVNFRSSGDRAAPDFGTGIDAGMEVCIVGVVFGIAAA